MAIALGPRPTGTAKATVKEDVSLVIDKSGSMDSCRSQVISGVNEFLGDLRRTADLEVTFSLTTFDTEVREVHRGAPLAKVSDLTPATYLPGGTTALYDALGLTIRAAEERLKGDQETKILIAIQTDGQENSSKEFTREQIREMIGRLDKEPNWTFVYLGADQDAWARSAGLGFHVGNTMSYDSGQTHRTLGRTFSASNDSSMVSSTLKKTKTFFNPDGEEDKP
jgi:uncharacterized protein YegL